MTYLFLFIPFIMILSLWSFFQNWEDQRPDLGGFGGKK